MKGKGKAEGTKAKGRREGININMKSYKDIFNGIYEQSREIERMLNSLIRKLKEK